MKKIATNQALNEHAALQNSACSPIRESTQRGHISNANSVTFNIWRKKFRLPDILGRMVMMMMTGS
jgi:hypothetical protein